MAMMYKNIGYKIDFLAEAFQNIISLSMLILISCI